jgi:hypothetical protein
MEEKIIDSMSDSTLTPADFITLMFERTDEDGILYIPGWHYDRPGWESNAPGSTDENDSYRCKIDWNLAKYEKVKEKFEEFYLALKEIAKFHDEIYEDLDNAETIIGDPELIKFWNLYLNPYELGEFDGNKVDEIYDKLDTIAWVKQIAGKISNGEKIEDFEKEVLTDYVDISVSVEEIAYRQKYLNFLHKQAEQRLGNNICAHDIILRSRRLYKLFAIKAPEIIINHEGHQLAAAFVLHEYGISRELVDNNIRLRLEQMELMSDEELDELCRPQKSNTRKSLAPLFVYEILSKYSDSKTHLRQNDILKKLSEYPYEISLERKALSRIIHNLTDSPQYAVFQDKSGVWVDKEN